MLDINNIYNMDCLEGLKLLDDNSIDSIVTDPPYELGFMNKKWDNTGIAYNVNMWKECLRVLKPGGHLLAFGGSRTYHRMACAIEDAGFEIRDQIMWITGQGFPKSMDIKKQVERKWNCTVDYQIVNGVEKNLYQSIIQKEMVGQDFVVEIVLPIVKNEGKIEFVNNVENNFISQNLIWKEQIEDIKGLFVVMNVNQNGKNNLQVKIILIGKEENLLGQMDMLLLTSTENINSNMILLWKNQLVDHLKRMNTYITLMELKQIIDLRILNSLLYQNTLKNITTTNHTALKPAHEPIVVARKPLSEKTVADNVLKWGTGGINIDGCRVEYQSEEDFENAKGGDSGSTKCNIFSANGKKQSEKITANGRFPANIIFECTCNEVIEGKESTPYVYAGREYDNKDTSMFNGDKPQAPSNYNDKGCGVIHTNPDCPCYILDEQSGISKSKKSMRGVGYTDSNIYGSGDVTFDTERGFDDIGGASRFFFCAKASKKERGEYNTHPTVKPIKLIEYLITLVTPPEGIVVDPFIGSGTLALASINKGFSYIGFELDKHYCEIAEKRINEHKKIS